VHAASSMSVQAKFLSENGLRDKFIRAKSVFIIRGI